MKLQVLQSGLLRSLVLAALLVSLLPSARAAIFVKIPDVPGDVLAEGYDDGSWFAVESGSYGADRDLVTAAQAGTESLNIGIGELLPIGLASHFGRPALPLIQASINGNSIGDVEIHLVELQPQPGGDATLTTFSVIKLTRAFVKSFTTQAGADERPWYQFKLIYNAIEITNTHPLSAGQGGGFSQFTTTWNLVTNTGGFSDGSEPNQEPTITGIEPASVAEDGTLTIPFSVADPDGPAADLSAAATSSNQALLPDSNMAITGSGSERTLTLSPALHQHGTATVSVVVSDFDASASTSFDLTVTPEPDPPELAAIDYQIGNVDMPLTIAIDVGDPDQPADSLLLSAIASDPTLLAEIVFAYHDVRGWELTLVPTGARSGSADVTVTATDDTGRRAVTTFLLALNSEENSAPTDIILSPDFILEHSPPGSPVGILAAIDPDDEADFLFELLDHAGGRFQLDGNQIVSGPTAEFDHESQPFEFIVVRATDREGAAYSKAVPIAIGNVNEPPSVSVKMPRIITPGSPPGVPIPYPNVVLADPDAGASGVTVTLSVLHGTLDLDDTGVLYGKVARNGTSRVIATAVIADIDMVLAAGGLRYAADPGYEGVDSLSAIIDDNGNSGVGEPLSASGSDAFTVPPERLRVWLDEVFTPEQQADPEFSGLLADGEGDGLTTLLEYKLGKNPLDPTDPATDIDISEITINGIPYVQLSFHQRTDASDPYTTLTVEVAKATSGWYSGLSATRTISREPAGEEMERVVVRTTVPRSEEPRQFLRFKVDYFGFADSL